MIDKLKQLQWDLRNVADFIITNIDLVKTDDASDRLFITFNFLDKRYTIQVTINEVTDLYDINISEFKFGLMQTMTTDSAKECIEDIIASYTDLNTMDLYLLHDVLKDRGFDSTVSKDKMIVVLPTEHFAIKINTNNGLLNAIIIGKDYQTKEYHFDSCYNLFNFIAILRNLYLDEEFQGAEDLITLYADLYLEYGGNLLYIEKDEVSDCNINIEHYLSYESKVKLVFNKFDYNDYQIQCCIWDDDYNVRVCDDNRVAKSPEEAFEWAKLVIDKFNRGEIK